MTAMKELEREKRDALYKGIAGVGISYEEAEKIFECLEDQCVIEMTPPQIEEPSLQTAEIRASHTGRYRGRSYKPGNIILNIKNAVTASLAFGMSSIASIGALSASQPMIALFTILAAVLSAADLGKTVLEDDAALILAVLWENRHTYGPLIDIEKGSELVDAYLESHGRDALSKRRYEDLLEDLHDIGSIGLRDEKIELKEKVHITY